MTIAEDAYEQLQNIQEHLDRALMSLELVQRKIESAAENLSRLDDSMNTGLDNLAWRLKQLRTSYHEPYVAVVDNIVDEIDSIKRVL